MFVSSAPTLGRQYSHSRTTSQRARTDSPSHPVTDEWAQRSTLFPSTVDTAIRLTRYNPKKRGYVSMPKLYPFPEIESCLKVLRMLHRRIVQRTVRQLIRWIRAGSGLDRHVPAI